MKTIIIYSSSYGYDNYFASKLSKQLKGEVLIVNASIDTIPSIDEFDNVIIGGSLYLGEISKKLNACTCDVELLKNKRLFLYLCCSLPVNLGKIIKNDFPEILFKKAISREFFGNEPRVEKMSLIHKIVTGLMKTVVIKEEKALAKQMPENIVKLAAIINKSGSKL